MPKVLHLADIHIGSSPDRVVEYKEVFNGLTDLIKKTLNGDPSTNLIVIIAGDIFHHKVRYCGDDVMLFNQLIRSLCGLNIGIIPGNHDTNLKNHNILDLLTPLIDKQKNIKYMKDSGIYEIGGVHFVHLSVYDTGVEASEWVKTLTYPEGVEQKDCVFLYHGIVNGSVFGSHVERDSKVSKAIFPMFKFVMLGDVHQHQYIEPNTAYSGSLIQQNLGEESKKGVIIWDTKDCSSKFVEVVNNYGYLKIDLRGKSLEESIEAIKSTGATKKMRKISLITDLPTTGVNLQVDEIKKLWGRIDVVNKKYDPINISDTVNVTLRSILLSKGANELQIEKIIKLHSDKTPAYNCKKWSILEVSWFNLYKYRGENKITFGTNSNIMGTIANNRAGKSSIIDIIVWILYNQFLRGDKSCIIHKGEKSAWANLIFVSNGIEYTIHRIETGGKSEVELFQLVDGVKTNITEQSKDRTYKKIVAIIGTLTQLLSTGLYINKNYDIISIGKTERVKLLPEILGLSDSDEINREISIKLRNLRKDIYSIPKPIKSDYKDLKKLAEDRIRLLEKEHGAIQSKYLVSIEDGELLARRKSIVESIEKTRVKLSSTNRLVGEIGTNIFDSYREKPQSNKLKAVELARTILPKIKEVDWAALELEIPPAFVHRDYHKLVIESEDLVIKYTAEISKYVPYGGKSVEDLVNELAGHPGYVCGVLFSDGCTSCQRNRKIIDNSSAEENEKKKDRLLGELRSAKIAEKLRVDHEKFVQLRSDEAANLEKLRILDSINEKWEILNQSKGAREMVGAIESAKVEVQRWTEYEGWLNYERLAPLRLEADLYQKEINVLEGELASIGTIVAPGDTKGLIYQMAKVEAEIKVEAEKVKSCEADLAIDIEHGGTLARLIEDEALYTLYQESIGVKGLMHTIVNTHIYSITDRVNDLLGQFTDFRIKTTLVESKLEINIIENGNEIQVQMGSGYQSFIISLAIRLVLTETLHAAPQFIIIDEGFGCIDSENMDSIISTLCSIKDMYNFMFVISHMDKLQNAIECPVYINDNGTWSSIGEGLKPGVDGDGAPPETICVAIESGKKTTCDCGVVVNRASLKKHVGSMRHMKWVQLGGVKPL